MSRLRSRPDIFQLWTPHMPRHLTWLRYGVAIGTLVAAAVPAMAQTAPAQPAQPALSAGVPSQGEQVSLDTISVQGAPVADVLTIGPTTTTITRQELDQAQVDSIAGIGNRLEAGIGFNRNNGSINIRGLEGARVLTTVDGIRQTYITDSRVDRGSTAAFDFNALNNLDLLRGNSGGATLGSGSLGGALAVRTLDPKDLIRNDKNFGFLAKGGYDSTDYAWFGSGAAAARAGNTYMLLQGSLRDGRQTQNMGDDPTIGSKRTEPNPARFTQVGFLGKIHHYVDEVHRFGVTGEYFRREDRFRTLTNAVSLTGNYRPGNHVTGDDVERRRVSLTYDYKQPGGFLDEASANLYWQQTTRNALLFARRFTSVAGPYGRNNEIDETAWGFNGHVMKSFQTGAVTHKLLAGTELRATELKQYSAGVDNCRKPYTGAFSACNNLHSNQSDMPRIEGRMVGLYIQDEIGAFDNRLRITPGVRFDWYEEKPQDTPSYSISSSYTGLPKSSSDNAWSPRIRVEYDVLRDAPVVKNVTLFAQWSKGFRAPTPGELYGKFGAVGTYLRTGNPDLRAETSNGVDVGVKFGDKTFGGGVTYFNTNYRNFIEQRQIEAPSRLYPQGGVTSYENVAKAQIQGVEANAYWNFAQYWTARGSFSWMRGVNKDTDTFLNSIPPLQAIVALAYNTEVWGAEGSAKFAAARNDVAALTGTNAGFQAPGYAIFNASVWWRPVKDLELQVGVYNIFDRRYFDAVSVPTGVLAQARNYYSEPGRTIKASLKYQF